MMPDLLLCRAPRMFLFTMGREESFGWQYFAYLLFSGRTACDNLVSLGDVLAEDHVRSSEPLEIGREKNIGLARHISIVCVVDVATIRCHQGSICGK
eukprot:SAG31_NODE_2342_length_5912_cov_1.363152_7_plen_97_part_00